jgi:hypothetical protein
MSAVIFPEMRAEVVSAIEALSDPAYQRRAWLRGEFPHEKYFDDFKLNVHILFDDTQVLSDPRSRVGTVIFESEIRSLRALGAVLGPLLDDLGESPDASYLADAQWSTVVAAADQVRAAMAENKADDSG